MTPARKPLQPLLLIFCTVALGAPAWALAPAERPRPDKPTEPIPFPDGVLDPDLHTAYVSSPKGGIQAIRLEDGKVLWTNDDVTAQPWLAAGGRLIARTRARRSVTATPARAPTPGSSRRTG